MTQTHQQPNTTQPNKEKMAAHDEQESDDLASSPQLAPVPSFSQDSVHSMDHAGGMLSFIGLDADCGVGCGVHFPCMNDQRFDHEFH